MQTFFLCHHFAYPPQTSLPIIAHGNVSSWANLFTPANGSSTKWPAYSCYIHKACHDICPTTLFENMQVILSKSYIRDYFLFSPLHSCSIQILLLLHQTNPNPVLIGMEFRKSLNKTVYNIRNP